MEALLSSTFLSKESEAEVSVQEMIAAMCIRTHLIKAL